MVGGIATIATPRYYRQVAEDAATLTDRVRARNLVREETRRMAYLVRMLPPL